MAEQNLRARMNRRLGSALMARHSIKAMLAANRGEVGGGFLEKPFVDQVQKIADELDKMLGPEPQPGPSSARQPRARTPVAQPVPE